MKKFMKIITAMVVTMAMVLSALPATFAAYDGEPNDTAAAHAVLCGVTEYHGEGHLMKHTSGSSVHINDDDSVTVSNGNPWNFSNDEWTLTKEELLNAMEKEIENVENTEHINSVDFDISILKYARGNFYESYVCEYWRRLNQLRKEKSEDTWSEIDEFFITNCIDQTVPIKYGDGILVCATSSLNFSDLPLTHWATDNIARIANLGYFSGYEDGTFKPDKEITHEEFTKIIVDVAGLTVIPVSADYKQGSDKTNRWASWAQPYLNAALDAGIITQNDTDIMQVNKPITRGEMAKLIGRLRVYIKNDDDENVELNDKISDWDTIPDEYKQYVAKAYKAGILKGYDNGSFKPNGKLTRAEASTVIIKLIDEKDDFKLFINGKLFNIEDVYEEIGIHLDIDLDTAKYVISDKDILVPARVMFEALDATTEWQSDTHTIIYTKTGYGTCRTAVGSNFIERKNGDKWAVCAEDIKPSIIYFDRIITPLFAVAKSLGMEVKYDKNTNIAEINYVDVTP